MTFAPSASVSKEVVDSDSSGSWLSYKGTQLDQGRDAGKDSLKNDPAAYEEIKAAVKAKLDEGKR